MPSVYGPAHRAERARLAPSVEAGEAECAELVCVMPDRWIEPGEEWDLAHDRRVPGTYLGPAHVRCNRREGARWAQTLAGHVYDDDETEATWWRL